MIRLLHLYTDGAWRGASNQVGLLIDGLHGQIEAQYAAVPQYSAMVQDRRWHAPLLLLPGGEVYDPRNLWRLLRFLRRERINLIDAHTAKAHTMACLLAPFVPGLRIVVHRRNDRRPSDAPLTRWKYRHPRIVAYIAVCEYIARVLYDYGIAPERIAIARSAVPDRVGPDPDRAAAARALRERHQVPEGRTLIAIASALAPEKGHDLLFEALARLRGEGLDFHLFVAGSGELQDTLPRRAKDLGLGERVVFLGFQRDIQSLLTGIDILAVPSRTEGIGAVSQEGLLAGCAVVASRAGGLPETVIDGETGLLHTVGDAEGLAECLHRLIENPALRLRLAADGRTHVLTTYSVNAMVAGNLAVYRRVMGERPGSSMNP